jgi:hypothetical protein
MSPAWLQGFFNIQFDNGSTGTSDLLDNDFRKSGQLFFYIIMTMCQFSEELIRSGQNLFFRDEFASARALSRE